ncbi:TPA: hypothetical protein HH409_000758 [Escherichia coli]|nr:hypothetical protein [Escherichia coli]
MDFFSVQNILVHIPIGAGGYDLSWIEAVGTIAGLLCIGLASLEKISNYFFGLINVTLFGIIFFQIQLYASLLLQVFFFAANIYGWYAWSINVISVVIFALQDVYAMSLEYIILTFIALNGSRMWINSARERGSRALSH